MARRRAVKANMPTYLHSTPTQSTDTSSPSLAGKRVAVIVFSYFPSDPRVFREAIALAGAGAEVDLFCLRKADKAGLLEPEKERHVILDDSLSLVAKSGVNVTRAKVKKSRAGKLAYVKQ